VLPAALADAAPLHNVRGVAAKQLARVAAQLPVVGVLAGVQRAAQELARRRLDGAGLREHVPATVRVTQCMLKRTF
jgi:hypothetical protein